jgi:DsbC/DsbD-like thiol-disulfide interchange protein
VAALALIGVAAAAQAAEPAIATSWVTDHASRARLIGGGDGGRRFVGIEIRLDDGWKTYWRNPGSSGVPPRLEWTGSENLAEATPLFPAPLRLPDRDGDTIGYKAQVLLPIEIKAADPARPVVLKLSLEYGVCKEVCIPVQTTFNLTVPTGAPPVEPLIKGALEQVPRPVGSRPGDPSVTAIKVDLKGEKPAIEIAARFPAGGKVADVFLEAPDGLWIPLAKPVGASEGSDRRFHVDLTDGADIGDLTGRVIRLTLVGSGGASETTFKLE